jgi:hypothetical protein
MSPRKTDTWFACEVIGKDVTISFGERVSSTCSSRSPPLASMGRSVERGPPFHPVPYDA